MRIDDVGLDAFADGLMVCARRVDRGASPYSQATLCRMFRDYQDAVISITWRRFFMTLPLGARRVIMKDQSERMLLETSSGDLTDAQRDFHANR